MEMGSISRRRDGNGWELKQWEAAQFYPTVCQAALKACMVKLMYSVASFSLAVYKIGFF